MTATATRHAVVYSGPIAASEAGALSGHAATCSCGHVVKTSLSERAAIKLGNEHADYMNLHKR